MRNIIIKQDAMEALHIVRVLEAAADNHEATARKLEVEPTGDDLIGAELENDHAKTLRGTVSAIKSAMWKEGVSMDVSFYHPTD
jgi:hypothetical protein